MAAAQQDKTERVTFRDLFEMQKDMHEQLDKMQCDLTTLKVQVAKNTVTVAAIVSVATSIATVLITKLISGA